MILVPGARTVHPRSAWVEPRYPITGPLDDATNNHTVVIHYTGAANVIDGDPGEDYSNLPATLRAKQRWWVDSKDKGYSLGYLWMVDWLGGIWQIRGWEFQSAANAGHNLNTVPILMLVDGNDKATAEAVHSVRLIVAEAQRRSGRTMKIKGHGQLRRETGVGTTTPCPGTGLQSQIDAGEFSPRPVTPPPPPPSPIGDTEMLILDHKPGTPEWTALSWTGTHLAHVYNGHADNVLRRASVTRAVVSDSEVDGIIASSTTVTPCPSTWVSTPRGAAWSARRVT
jgi:hypothetical protein